MPDQTQNKHFFNVMPEITGGPITKPKSPVFTPAPQINTQQVDTSKAGLTLDNKSKLLTPKWILLIAGILLLLIAGSAAAFWYFSQSGTEEQTQEDQIVIPDEPEPNPDITTPADWQMRYFGTEVCTELVSCGDKADPDRDGLDNKAEFEKNTDPNNPDTDGEGVADGDEINIFNMDPLLSRTYRSGNYLDSDFIKGGYDITNDLPYTNEKLLEIKSLIKTFGLHQPTLTTLGPVAFQLYEFIDPNLPQLPANLDVSPQAKLDRDSQRQSTIKKIGVALIKYQQEKKSFPPTDDFVVMADQIKNYNQVATNYNDPISIIPYVYGYQVGNNNTEFTLTYYSETQNQLIKYTSKNATEDEAKEANQAYDERRKEDLENFQQALLVYSTTQLDPNSEKQFIFPSADRLKDELARYITQIPVDPVTKQEYQYLVGVNFDSFTIKAQLQNPKAGTTGYQCTQLECKEY